MKYDSFVSLLQFLWIFDEKNDGLCFVGDGSQETFCQCFDAFIGSRCEINLCENKQCFNGGSCTLDQSNLENRTKCDCTDPFSGSLCETNLCDDKECLNGGKCVLDRRDHGNIKAKCDCAREFDGERCELPLVCFLGEPCQNGGKCKLVQEKNSSNQDSFIWESLNDIVWYNKTIKDIWMHM